MDYEIMMNGNVKIGMHAPDFEADTTMGKRTLSDYRGKWLVLFSHPGDFTPVCTTEFIAFSKANTYFQNLNTELLGLSIDSNSSHLAWLYDIYIKTGIKVPFPVIADRNGAIARKYGMISNDVSTTETVRNVFIIDDKGIIRLILVYPMNVGRAIAEILRAIEALQMYDKTKLSTPANWMPDQPLVVGAPKTFDELEARMQEIEKNKNGMNWYLSFKNPEEEIMVKNLENKEQLVKIIEEKNKNGKY